MKRALAGRRAARQCPAKYTNYQLRLRRTSPSFTLWPALTQILATVPSAGELTGVFIFMASRVTSKSPALTFWPSLTFTATTTAASGQATSLAPAGAGAAFLGAGAAGAATGRRNRGSGGCGSRRRSDGRDSRAEDFNFDFVRFAFYCYAQLFHKKRFLLIEFNGCVIF